MTQENLAWLAEELRFPSVEEAPDGSIRFNEAARAAAGDDSPKDIVAAVAMLSKGAATAEAVEAVVSAARKDGRASLAHPNGRLLVTCSDANLVTAWATPDPRAFAEGVQARAAAVDLAAGVSHEVSNALSAIIGWAQLSRERPDMAPPEESLKLIERSAQAARGATRDLLQMVRDKDQEPGQTDLAALVQDVFRLLRPEAQKKRVSLHRSGDLSCWTVGSESQLFSVVWNLAHNAVQIVDRGGEVRIAVHENDDCAVLEVIDNGPGMSAEQRDRAFERYYTTRREGTGLGLSIVRNTVEALGGKIRLDSSPGDGAKFHIELPRAEEQTGVNKLRKRTPHISSVLQQERTDNVRVLIVEDDEGIRDLLATTLGVCGLDATAYPDAQSALDAAPEQYSVAVLDLTLPDERGDRLLAALRERGIVKDAIIMSGGPPPSEIDPNGKPYRWIRKPFEPSAIVVCIRELLDVAASKSGQAAAS